jgi:regulation of enolase protein 1 (concanavalin A-like superfamily)
MNQSYLAPADITLSADAAIANGAIGRVEFFKNGSLAGTSYTAPYSLTLVAQPTGNYSLYARAYDTGGKSVFSPTTTVSVVDPPGLAVYLKTPVANAYYTIGSGLQFNAIATYPGGTIARVEFYDGSTYLGKDTSTPYYYTWSTAPAGTHTLTARAIGGDGRVVASPPVSVTVGPTNQPPYVSLVYPTDGSTVVATSALTLQTDASDSDGNLSQVEYYQGGVRLGSTSVSPYSFDWQGVPVGNHSLSARAYDSAGASYTSTPVSFSVALGESWQHQDVGDFALPGSTTSDGSTGTWTIRAAGSDIWGTDDSFRYVYRPLSGDGSLVARVNRLDNTHAWAKAGVMIREGLASTSRNATIALTPANGVAFQYRAASGGRSSSVQAAGKQAPYWLKLERKGTTFSGYYSSNGSQWTLLGSCTLALAKEISIGLAVTSHNSAALTTAVFTDVVFIAAPVS